MKNDGEIINKARNVILNSFIAENKLPGFPEIIGRDRSTEWGGTISALHVLHDMSSTQQVDTAIDESIKGIIASQNESTHAWGAGGVDLVEATSEIVYYLCKDYPKYDDVKKSIDGAVTYIKSKYYDKGYFHSGAYSGQSEHTLYATYQAVRALVQVNELSKDEINNIKNWVISNRTSDGLWADNNNSNQFSIAHSIYALLTLLLLGYNSRDLEKEFKRQIRKIFKSIINNNTYFYYEEYSIPIDESDPSGKMFKRVRINHFVLPFAIELFLNIGCFYKARILKERLKEIRYDGAWGLYQSFRTTWATQQAVEALNEYQECKRTWFDVIPSFFILLWYKYLPIVIIIIVAVIAMVLFFSSATVKNWCISFVLGVIAGALANKITD